MFEIVSHDDVVIDGSDPLLEASVNILFLTGPHS